MGKELVKSHPLQISYWQLMVSMRKLIFWSGICLLRAQLIADGPVIMYILTGLKGFKKKLQEVGKESGGRA